MTRPATVWDPLPDVTAAAAGRIPARWHQEAQEPSHGVIKHAARGTHESLIRQSLARFDPYMRIGLGRPYHRNLC